MGPEKWELIFFGPMFDFFRNLGTREVRTNFCSDLFSTFFQIYEGIWCHSPNYWPDFVSFVEFLTGFDVIRRNIERIWCHSPNFWPDLVSFAELLTGVGVIRRSIEEICRHSPNYWNDFQLFPESGNPRSVNYFVFGPILDFFRNLGTRELWTFSFRAYFRLFPESGNPRSVNYFVSGLFLTFSGIWEPEKCELFVSGPIFNFFRKLTSFAELLEGFAICQLAAGSS